MSSQEALEIFDVCNTVVISTALLFTLPLAVFVYTKLLFVLPYSRNFTFKLIVFNGMTVITSIIYKNIDQNRVIGASVLS